MSKTFFTLMILASSISAHTASAQRTWGWAKTGNCVLTAITTDHSGNIYGTGYFSDSTLTLGSFTLHNCSATTIYAQNMFVVKYDPLGNVLWAVSPGYQPVNDRYFVDPASITTDINNNVYVTGTFLCDQVSFGTTVLGASHHALALIVKYDSAGNVVWAKSGATNKPLSCSSVTTDLSGNLVVCGTFRAPIQFNSTWIGSQDSSGMYLVKFDPSGGVIWGKSIFGGAQIAVATDQRGNIASAGTFYGTLNIDGIDLTSVGSTDIFLAEFDAAGNVEWARTAGGTAAEVAEKVTVDGAGNILLTGEFDSDDISFGSLTHTKDHSDSTNLFVAKYDNLGHALWARSAAGSGVDRSSAMICDQWDNVYITGYYSSPALIFDGGTITNANTNYYNMFLTEYDATGNNLLVTGNGCDKATTANCIAAGKDGTIYCGGRFDGTELHLGSNTLLENNSPSFQQMFLAKYIDATGTGEITPAKSDFSVYPNPAVSDLNLVSSEKIHTLTIYNVAGQIMYSQLCNTHTARVNVANFSNGIYFISVNETKFSKFVKQ